jgi:uncharacterized protein
MLIEYIIEIFHNPVVIAGALAWFSAQILKTITNAIVSREFDPARLLGDGGMPSAHSATVTAVAISAGREAGFQSAVFGVAFFFALVVMHDAMGVRRETEKQTKVLKSLVESMSGEYSPEEKLKEFVGHTPTQVLAGFCLGIIVSLLCYF